MAPAPTCAAVASGTSSANGPRPSPPRQDTTSGSPPPERPRTAPAAVTTVATVAASAFSGQIPRRSDCRGRSGLEPPARAAQSRRPEPRPVRPVRSRRPRGGLPPPSGLAPLARNPRQTPLPASPAALFVSSPGEAATGQPLHSVAELAACRRATGDHSHLPPLAGCRPTRDGGRHLGLPKDLPRPVVADVAPPPLPTRPAKEAADALSLSTRMLSASAQCSQCCRWSLVPLEGDLCRKQGGAPNKSTTSSEQDPLQLLVREF